MKIPVIVFVIVGTTLLNDAIAHQCEQNDRELWRENREYKRTMALVGELFKCIDRSDSNNYGLRDKAQCYEFTGRAIDTVYGRDSFREGQSYLSASSMAQKLHAGEINEWTRLGPASSQDVLSLAAKLTKKGKPVIAAWLGSGGAGHVSLIMPGGLAFSSSWGLKVPNAASISLGALNNSFYGCRLSYALSKDKMARTDLFTLDQNPE